MQKAIIPDYLLRHIPPTDRLKTFVHMTNYLNHFTVVRDENIGFGLQINNHTLNVEPSGPMINHAVTNDRSMQSFFRCLLMYKERPHKNYILSRNLVEILSEVKSDLKTNFLPRDFNAYMVMPGLKDPDGEEIEGFFVYLFDSPAGGIEFSVCYFIKNSIHIGHFNFLFEDDNKAIVEWVKQFPHYRNEPLPGYNGIVSFEGKNQSVDHLATILNAVVYVANSYDPLEEWENDFPTKDSRQTRKIKKKFTHLPYILVGEGVKRIRHQHTDSTVVRAHHRLQPCGPNRSKVKLIVVREHERHYQKDEENQCHP